MARKADIEIGQPLSKASQNPISTFDKYKRPRVTRGRFRGSECFQPFFLQPLDIHVHATAREEPKEENRSFDRCIRALSLLEARFHSLFIPRAFSTSAEERHGDPISPFSYSVFIILLLLYSFPIVAGDGTESNDNEKEGL